MIRCGIGYDVHRFAEGRKLILGGVEIAHSHGLEGHSDADVLLHAIADALLGAVAASDIGQHFPNTDAIGTPDSNGSVKATTNEKLGAVGRSEGIAAIAIATVDVE